jgi:glycine oxidase
MAADRSAVLVVGGGVVGRSVAYYLALRDIEVHIIDAGPDVSSTTRASLGVLTHFNGGDNPYSALYRDGHASYEELAVQLQAETGVDIGWRPLGGIDLILSDEDEAAARELLRFNRERGCVAEQVDAAELRRLEPLISTEVRGGVYFPGDHRVDPEKLAQGLLRAVEQRRGRLFSGESLEGFEESSARGVVVRTNRGTRAAEFLVLAAGSWSGLLGERLGVSIPVRPVRGQHSRFGPGAAVRHVLRHGGHQLVAAAGQVIVGATTEDVGFDTETTATAARLFEGAWRQLLEVQPEPVEQRAGLRPKPRGGRPLIGPLSAHPRILVATGHYKNGILLGPITGQVISEWIVEGRPSRDMAYFAAER